MFKQVFLEKGERRPWTLAVSFGLQCAFVGVLILVPLIFTEAGPRVLSFTSIIEPPPGLPQPSADQPGRRVTPVKAPPSDLQAGRLVAPPEIPDKIAVVFDLPELPPAHSIGVADGVPWGTGPSSGRTLVMNLIGPRPAAPAPALKPEIARRMTVKSQVQQAMAVSQPMPVYPQPARSARISGVVRLSATISEAGTIEHLRVLEGHPWLVRAALDAVMQWRYRPTMLNGVPVKVDTTIEVHFKLDR